MTVKNPRLAASATAKVHPLLIYLVHPMSLHPSTPIALTTRKLSLAYEGNPIIQGLDLAIPQGQVTALVGPNGCGKSTLLRGLARLLKPQGGTVYLEGDAIAHLPTKALAKRLGILPQSPAAPEGLTVRELVAQGRYPHQTWLQQWSKEDELAVEAAIATTHLEDFANRPLDTLSGGQRQRAWIAMALAQDTQTLLLDEPTTYLDLAHQIEVLDLLADLNHSQGKTIVMVLHDLNLACRYADHLIALKQGLVQAQGAPATVMTETLVRQVFGLESKILLDPVAGTPLCIPIGRSRCAVA
ncbi:MAG TPA: ABC transporter ATP-binding protein [Trichocoleus sp.]